MAKRYNVLLSLQDGANETFSATFVLQLPVSPAPTNISSAEALHEARLAAYYVASVFLIYGLSIVLLIASSIRRKRHKQMQDQQIDKYLREFQVVQETSSKSYHRQLKHTIAAKLEALPRNQSATHERLTHIVPLAIGLPLAPWPQDGERVADLPPEQQRQVSDMKTHTSESGISELDYVRESSYDADDISAPTSPLHPPNYGDNFGETSFAERRPVGGLVLHVGDNRCSWQDINIDDSPNEEILPNGEGVPHLATNAVLDVELKMSEHHAMLDHIVPKTTRPGNERDSVEFISSDSYYVGCHGPVRETIL